MGKRIFWSLVIIIGVVAVVYYVRQSQLNKQNTDGAVVCVQNCDTPEQKARFAQLNSGDTADGQSERKDHSSSQDAAAVAAGYPAAAAPASSNDPSQPMQPGQGYGNNQVVPNVIPANQKPAPDNAYGGYGMSNNANVTATTNARQMAATPVGLPLTDSRSPNAPNDLRFAGSGNYQWYRQGNLTWRIDTGTGRSCIIYATLEEWQKQIVYSHGCGRNA